MKATDGLSITDKLGIAGLPLALGPSWYLMHQVNINRDIAIGLDDKVAAATLLIGLVLCAAAAFGLALRR